MLLTQLGNPQCLRDHKGASEPVISATHAACSSLTLGIRPAATSSPAMTSPITVRKWEARAALVDVEGGVVVID